MQASARTMESHNQDGISFRGRQHQQQPQHHQGQNATAANQQLRQKLQLRTNQSLQDQLEMIIEHQQQQQQIHSPYSDFSNVLYSQNMSNSMANHINMMNSLNSPMAMNGMNSYANQAFLNNLQAASNGLSKGSAAQGDGGSAQMNSPMNHAMMNSQLRSPTVKRSISTSNAPGEASTSSATSPVVLGMDMSQMPSKSHSSTQSDFSGQPTHKLSNHTQSGMSPQNFEKRRDSMSSFPLNLDMDFQYDTGSGGITTTSSGSTLTEFTKRRNWSQRIIEELQDLLCILTPNGKMRYCSPNTTAITGYTPDELLNRMVTDHVHVDDSHIFIREFHESIASGQPLRMFFRFRRKDGTYTIFEANGHPHFSDQRHMPSNTTTSICSGFFMMARVYPTKNVALLDSFLEHKIENERLKRRIAELRQEEFEDQQAQIKSRSEASTKGNDNAYSEFDFRFRIPSLDRSHSEFSSLTSTPGSPGNIERQAASKSMPPPAMPAQPGQLTRQNLDSLPVRGDSLRDKMARYEGVTHADTIEMLTGLRYTEGERSRGISTGDTSPSLIRGDAGVPMSADRESRGSGERKKKIKVANEYVCTDCGTLDSPEWRKGPTGPKTLCNACGLRWAKKEKKRSSTSGPSAQAPPLGGPVPPLPPVPQDGMFD